MDLSDPTKKPRAESIVPMINVVFLLLIFFLMTSRLAQPDPFDITLPEAALDTDVDADLELFVDRTGRLSFERIEGEDAIVAIASRANRDSRLQLRADGRVEGAVIAGLLKRLTEKGLASVELVVTPK